MRSCCSGDCVQGPTVAFSYIIPLVLAGIALWVVLASHSHAPARRGLKVSDKHRCLMDFEGKPFFHLADTAWELFHRLDRNKADLYLRDCASKRV